MELTYLETIEAFFYLMETIVSDSVKDMLWFYKSVLGGLK